MNGPQAGWLPDGRRLHLHHGPIDLIAEAFGEDGERMAACAQARDRFDTVLTRLVDELAELRRPAGSIPRRFEGPVARRMERAACRFGGRFFITPMAAVAGAVAEEVLAAMVAGRRLDRAYVNNGGDIALFLAPGHEIRAAVAGTGHGLSDRLAVRASDPVRGIATSGWRGRSHSLGIADAVTVLGRDAAAADAAATLIANAVDLPGHPAIERTPANLLAPDSDLGGRPVTTGVGSLSPGDVSKALERGLRAADDFAARGLIVSAALFLNGEARQTGFADMSRPVVPPSVLPDISPTRGEIGLSPGSPPPLQRSRSAKSLKPPISPLVGEMSGRTEGGDVERSRRRTAEGRDHA